MSLPEDLRTFLLGDPGLSGLVGTRVYPLRLPQQPALPAVTYAWVGGDRAHVLAGPAGVASPRLQFDCWAGTYLQAHAVFDALRRRLDGYRGLAGAATRVQGAFLEAERDFYEESADAGTGSGVGLYRRSGDFFIHHGEET